MLAATKTIPQVNTTTVLLVDDIILNPVPRCVEVLDSSLMQPIKTVK